MSVLLNNIYYLMFVFFLVASIAFFFVSTRKVDLIDYNLKFYTAKLFEKIMNSLSKIITILFVLIILITIYKIALSVGVTSYSNKIYEWTNKNNDVFNTILGAFLASFLGILTQIMISKKTNKNEKSKYSKLLYNDLNYIMYKMSLYISTISSYKEEYPELFETFFKRINFDDNWRMNYGYLTDKMPINYYNQVTEIYSLIERFNISIDKKDINQMKRVILEYRLLDNSVKIIRDANGISNDELLNAFHRISQNKKVKTKILSNFIREVKIKKIVKKYSAVIEERIYKMILESKETKISPINNKVKGWLIEEYRDLKKMKNQDIDTIIFIIGMKSNKFDLVWDEYSIKDKDNLK